MYMCIYFLIDDDLYLEPFFMFSIAALRNSKSAVVNMGVKAGIYITQVTLKSLSM